MVHRWFPATFCPKDAQCSTNGELHPSNGHTIQSMVYDHFPDPILGEIRHFTKDPQNDPMNANYGWVKCEGQLIQIAQNIEVFSLLGNTYGGDGRESFGLPDLRAAGDSNYYIAMNGETPGFVGP